jgi:F0F1-type ATP synthase membrane subunit c/vacuolar-type H+-ATPase subunit K
VTALVCFVFSLLTAATVKVFCDLGKLYFKKNVCHIGLQETVVLVAFICPFLLCLYVVFSVIFFALDLFVEEK